MNCELHSSVRTASIVVLAIFCKNFLYLRSRRASGDQHQPATIQHHTCNNNFFTPTESYRVYFYSYCDIEIIHLRKNKKKFNFFLIQNSKLKMSRRKQYLHKIFDEEFETGVPHYYGRIIAKKLPSTQTVLSNISSEGATRNDRHAGRR